MKAIIRWPLSAAALFLLVAQTPVPKDDAEKAQDALRDCHIASAKYYGSNSCQAPAYIVGAVFASCMSEENAFKAAVQRGRPNDQLYPTELIKQIHIKMEPFIEEIVLDQQIKIRKCP
ncbi:MAG TPA: hypothetical protein VFC38_11220 [Stellaceae bacterium]|nr:hypothetical protein [Stellaceae bacterium]